MKKLILIFIIPLFLWSCGTMKSYGEQVFKYQNQVLVELMNIIIDFEERDDPIVEILYDYEDDLNEVCNPIQKTALTQMSGKEVPFKEGYNASITMSDCYDKAIEVRQHLVSSGLWTGQFSEGM